MTDQAPLAGVKDGVTPAGTPERATLMLPLNPFNGVAVSVLTPVPPGATVRVAGDIASVKLGACATVRLIVVVMLRLPEVPVTVTVDDVSAAELAAVNVSVLALVVLAGLNAAVTPVGRPETFSATVPLKPYSGFTVIALVLVAPGATLTLVGDAERVNVGGPVTVSVSRTVLVRLPDVPLIVIVVGPAAAEAATVSVSVLLVVAAAGLNDAVTPVGRPDAVRFTVPLKPFSGLMVMVLVPVVPGAMESASVDDERPNAGALPTPVRALING